MHSLHNKNIWYYHVSSVCCRWHNKMYTHKGTILIMTILRMKVHLGNLMNAVDRDVSCVCYINSIVRMALSACRTGIVTCMNTSFGTPSSELFSRSFNMSTTLTGRPSVPITTWSVYGVFPLPFTTVSSLPWELTTSTKHSLSEFLLSLHAGKKTGNK